MNKNNKVKKTTLSEKQTFNLGLKFAQNLQGGEIIGLIGELGAGKTVFIKGLSRGLGIKKTITSPTFVLMKVYQIQNKKIKNLCHVDAYRLKSGQDLIDIGIKDYLGKSNAVTVIEWADRVKSILPKNKIIVKIRSGKKQNQRIIEISK